MANVSSDFKTDFASASLISSVPQIISQMKALNELSAAVASFRLCCFFIIAIFLFKKFFVKDEKTKRFSQIPGPLSFPVIGSLFAIGRKPHRSLTKMRRTYGDIFQVRIGSRPIVVLDGLDTIRSALIDQAVTFAGRPSMAIFDQASEGKSMAFTSYSNTWRLHRRLAERAMSVVSNDSQFINNVVTHEMQTLVNRLKAKSSVSGRVNPLEEVVLGVAHVKYSLCYGDSHSDPEHFEAMMRATLDVVGCQTTGDPTDFFPWARRLFSRRARYVQSVCDRMMALTASKEREHLATYDRTRIRDVLDALIRFGIETKCPLEQDRVLHTVQEYIGAGLDIVYVTFLWILVYLTEFPEIQEEVRREVDRVIGNERQPDISDMEKMPYTEAFLFEVLRHSCLVPFALPHSTIADAKLGDYLIPQDTFVMVNMYSISRDEKIWQQPEEFNPQRFLGSDGMHQPIDRNSPAFFLFGIGKRKCLGEKFSRREMFLFTTLLVQQCRLLKPAGVSHINLEPQSGIVLRPQPFDIVVEQRLE